MPRLEGSYSRPRQAPRVKRKPQAAGPPTPTRPVPQVSARRRFEPVYAPLSVPERQKVLASKDATPYVRAARQVHAKRIRQLNTDEGARERLARRELIRAFAQAAAASGRVRLEPVKPKRPEGGLLPTATAGLGILGTIASGIDKAAGTHTREFLEKAAGNAPADAAELAVTTPSSIAKLATTAVTHPTKVPGMLAEPYKQLAADPAGFISEHPVSALLMLQPAARVPGRAAGRVARLTKKQSLARPTATLPGTVLRQQRTGSRDIVVRAVQAHTDANRAKRGRAPVMTDKEILRRTDEFHDAARKRGQRDMRQAAQEAHEQYGHLPPAERQAAVHKHMSTAHKRSQAKANRRFALEFGGTAYRTPEGVLLKPKGQADVALHATRETAQAVADTAPFDAAVIRAGRNQYAVVPRIAVQRLNKHRKVGTGKAVGSKVFRTARRSFTQTVLPLSPKWLTGQGAEAGFRAAVAGAGPTSYIRGRRVVKRLEEQKPGAGQQLLDRALGGQAGITGPASEALGVAREYALGQRTLAQEFADTSLRKPAAAMTKAGAAPGVRHIRAGWNRYTNFVFDRVNGAIENTAQTAMLGKAVRRGPLMEKEKFLGLSDRAIEEAAQGLHATEAQVELGRAVDRAYGAYSKFSAEKRESLMHSAPFYPWLRNVVTFLGKVLPVDHPVKAALLTDLDAAEQDWRQAHGLSYRGGKRRDDFLLGSTPIGKGDQVIRIGHFLPFAPADVPGTIGQLFLPQFAGIRDALLGRDFKGGSLKGSHLAQALVTAVETHIPGVAQLDRALGLSEHYLNKKGPSVLQGKPLGPAVRRLVNPVEPTAPGHTRVKRKTKPFDYGTAGHRDYSGGGNFDYGTAK